jgi:ureidoglycolate dehydrogenase (NAD+)
MMEAVAVASERAKARGASIGIMRDATHAAAIGRYAHWVVERGLACIILAAAYPFMPYHGSRQASLPTAPIVMGVPTARHGPVVLDMASSIVAMGKIHTARAKGESLDEGWALDAQGKPTTDPHKAAMPLPLGGPKGSGLSLMIEFLAGVLGGSSILTRVLGPERSTRNAQNALIVVMDVTAFRPDGGFVADADTLADTIKQLPLRDGFDEILLPGERGGRTEKSRRASGIPIPAGTWNALKQVAVTHALELPKTGG